MSGLRFRASSNIRFWRALKRESSIGYHYTCRRHGLLSAGPLLFGGWLPVALFQTAHHHGGDELLVAVLGDFDHSSLFTAEHHRAQPEFLVLDLGALVIGIGSHRLVYSSLLEWIA